MSKVRLLAQVNRFDYWSTEISFFIRLSKEVKEDLLVWQLFHSGFNGYSFFLADQWKNSHQLELYLTPLVPWVMVLSWVDIGVMVNSQVAGVI